LNDEQKKAYLEKYARAKANGEKFWPESIYKDLLMSTALFVLLVILAVFVGVAQEPKADPSDSAYIPRPEWYFLFLFEMLKFFPGKIEWIGTAVIPGLAVLALFLLPFLDRNPYRHWRKRLVGLSVMGVIVLAMIGLTIRAVATTPPSEETGTIAGTLSEQILAGTDLYSIQCAECHGAEGEGGEIVGVEGMEGVVLAPINDEDVMYPFSDDTLFNIIAFGQPIQGMPPFARQFGGELGPGDIEAIVAFMRYTWDDRAELPPEVEAAGAIPVLAEGEVPSYEVHMAPLIKRYCISCHRPGKKNNNYPMTTYEEVMTSGDNAPSVIPGDLNSPLIRLIHREELEFSGPMPPSRALKPEIVVIFERWVAGGAPNTPAEAASASSQLAPAVEEPTATPQP
jgi:menaquinol-cytochrome c reductase cytochrome b/c subunit